MSHKKSSIADEKSSAQPAGQASSWGRSARDTVEAIAIAFALAFLFKTFEAEAFVIPTGSMAPTLMGRHKDVECPQCGYRYSASGSEEVDREGNLRRNAMGEVDAGFEIVRCSCPICRFPMSVDPRDSQAVDAGTHPSYSGDMIWVSKVPYHLTEPKRWDVIVFRYPREAETYYIKRLIGLPNETVKIFHGDIYAKLKGEADFKLARKPPEKILAMAQVVHDNDYVSPALREAGWPPRWSTWSAGETNVKGAWAMSEDTKTYRIDGSAPGEEWIRYEHIVPPESFWRGRERGQLPGGREPQPQLITDFYAFNTRVMRNDANYAMAPSMIGLHWVGDLVLDCTANVKSDQGTVMLDLVKAGRHYRASIDVADGTARLSIDAQPNWRRTGQTSVRGKGQHHLMFANVDRQLVLWVDGKLVTFDGPTTYEDGSPERPVSTQNDEGDLAPLGIGSRGAALEVSHLRVLRDIYYIADHQDRFPITDYQSPGSIVPILPTHELIEFLSEPDAWKTRGGASVFDERQAATFELSPQQFFVLGDNSPASSDARFWTGEHYVDRSLLVGKALLIYWPHPYNVTIPILNISLPVIPNFSDMGFIR